MNIFFSMSTPLCVPRLIGATRLSNGLKRRLWLHVAINWRTILCRADEYSPLVPRSIHEKFCRDPRAPLPVAALSLKTPTGFQRLQPQLTLAPTAQVAYGKPKKDVEADVG